MRLVREMIREDCRACQKFLFVKILHNQRINFFNVKNDKRTLQSLPKILFKILRNHGIKFVSMKNNGFNTKKDLLVTRNLSSGTAPACVTLNRVAVSWGTASSGVMRRSIIERSSTTSIPVSIGDTDRLLLVEPSRPESELVVERRRSRNLRTKLKERD